MVYFVSCDDEFSAVFVTSGMILSYILRGLWKRLIWV